MSRENFLEYYRILGFLKGPKTLDLYHRMREFLNILESPDEDTLSNFTLKLLLENVDINSESIVIDLTFSFNTLYRKKYMQFFMPCIKKDLENLKLGKGEYRKGLLKEITIRDDELDNLI